MFGFLRSTLSAAQTRDVAVLEGRRSNGGKEVGALSVEEGRFSSQQLPDSRVAGVAVPCLCRALGPPAWDSRQVEEARGAVAMENA